MNLSDDEEILAEYKFRGASDRFWLLTNRRFVASEKAAEENIPLSKITSVRTEFSRMIFVLAIGAAILFCTLVGQAVVLKTLADIQSTIATAKSLGGGASVSDEIRGLASLSAEAPTIEALLLLTAIFAVWTMYLGWRGQTRLEINSVDGKKKYDIQGHDKDLLRFGQTISHRFN